LELIQTLTGFDMPSLSAAFPGKRVCHTTLFFLLTSIHTNAGNQKQACAKFSTFQSSSLVNSDQWFASCEAQQNTGTSQRDLLT